MSLQIEPLADPAQGRVVRALSVSDARSRACRRGALRRRAARARRLLLSRSARGPRGRRDPADERGARQH